MNKDRYYNVSQVCMFLDLLRLEVEPTIVELIQDNAASPGIGQHYNSVLHHSRWESDPSSGNTTLSSGDGNESQQCHKKQRLLPPQRPIRQSSFTSSSNERIVIAEQHPVKLDGPTANSCYSKILHFRYEDLSNNEKVSNKNFNSSPTNKDASNEMK